MEFEIEIEGPFAAISTLSHQLKNLSPGFETALKTSHHKGRKGKISFVEIGNEFLDNKLLQISRIIKEIEKSLSPEASIEIRVRNLSYSEPVIGDGQFEEPFHPIPSITVQPWSSSTPRLKDPGAIALDPEHAFGTGRHPTTRLCLQIMNLIANDPSFPRGLQDQEVLDFGCGTGLLALAAIHMGAKRVVGVEIDPASAKAAKRNVTLNRLSHRIEIREGSWRVVKEKYGLVLTNLVAAALLRNGRHISGWVREEGRVVVSGFGKNQNDEMRRFFADTGFIISRDFALDGWGALLMEWKE